MGFVFCVTGFFACFVLGRSSLVAGVGSVLTAGYLYGILRANYPDGATYFLFDCSAMGFYLSLLAGLPKSASNPSVRPVQTWLVTLIAWAGLIALIPIQHMLIQLVGLRGNAFLLPFLLVGAWLQREDADRLALWFGVLNCVAFAFAMGEFVLGVPTFFPRNAVTELIYRSRDVAGNAAFRIPACFGNAHSYGGTMVLTIPWMLGSLVQPRTPTLQKSFLSGAIVLALLGVFLCAARLYVVLLGVLILVVTFSGQMRGGFLVVWLLVLGGVGFLISREERMQRFLSLGDTDMVVARLEGSVNKSFLELLLEYPMGNGMGGGGTSIPFFMAHLVENRVVIENEYGRIMLEQGVPGLLLWGAFIGWILMHWPRDRREPWLFGKQTLWVVCVGNFAIATIGSGLMTSIPMSVMTFLSIGFAVSTQPLPGYKPALSAGRLMRPPPCASRLSTPG